MSSRAQQAMPIPKQLLNLKLSLNWNSEKAMSLLKTSKKKISLLA